MCDTTLQRSPIELLWTAAKKKQDGERGEGIEEEEQKLDLPSFFFCIGIPFLVHHHAKLFVTQLVVLKLKFPPSGALFIGMLCFTTDP